MRFISNIGFILLAIYFLHITFLNAQEKIATIRTDSDFSSKDFSIGYYDRFDKKNIINLQNDGQMTRLCLDTNFNLISSYDAFKTDISLKQRKTGKLKYLTDLVLKEGLYEAYYDKNTLKIIKLDFAAKEDPQKQVRL